MQIIEYLKSLFWTPPPVPKYRLPIMARLAGVEKIITDVAEFFYVDGFRDGWIAATAVYAFILASGTVIYLMSRRNDATAH